MRCSGFVWLQGTRCCERHVQCCDTRTDMRRIAVTAQSVAAAEPTLIVVFVPRSHASIGTGRLYAVGRSGDSSNGSSEVEVPGSALHDVNVFPRYISPRVARCTATAMNSVP
jgi:hypothetical protein